MATSDRILHLETCFGFCCRSNDLWSVYNRTLQGNLLYLCRVCTVVLVSELCVREGGGGREGETEREREKRREMGIAAQTCVLYHT